MAAYERKRAKSIYSKELKQALGSFLNTKAV